MKSFYKTGADLLREQINDDNALPFDVTADNLIFGKPSALLEGTEGQHRVAVRGIQNSDYRNRPLTVEYTKLDLSVLFNGNYRPRVTALGQSSLYRLLPDINKALGMQLTPEDLVNVDIAQLGEGNELTLELRARPESLAFRGFTRITFNRQLIYLWDKIDQRFYEELKHPDPLLEGYTSAGLLTWGLDFTLVYPELRVRNHYNSWRGGFQYKAALRTKLKDIYGIESWPDNTQSEEGVLRDYDTRDVKEANTDYQRVVVQTGIRANGYIGTAYFHYNRL